jgi:hypothetical protein
MHYTIIAAFAAALVCLSPTVDARGSGSHSSSHASHHAGSSGHGHARAAGIARDSHGKLARSVKAKDSFKKSHPCPLTGKTHGACPGYVIDHVQSLKHGGSDSASNMQWQTTQVAKQKDRWE